MSLCSELILQPVITLHHYAHYCPEYVYKHSSQWRSHRNFHSVECTRANIYIVVPILALQTGAITVRSVRTTQKLKINCDVCVCDLL